MPILKMKMCEIIDRVSEIPDTEDCYIISVTGLNDKPLIPYEDEPGIMLGHILWAPQVDCVYQAKEAVRHYDRDKDAGGYQEDKDSWNYYWNRNNVYVTFQYGEGVPQTPSGTPMLTHVIKYDYCTQCLRQCGYIIEDCPDRRLTAMVDDIQEGRYVSHHLDAYETWHRNKRKLK